MIRNYFKIAWRNLINNKGYSAINIDGLVVGMAVAIIIGFWIYGELSFNKNFKSYDRIAQVMQHIDVNDTRETWKSLPDVAGEELRNSYGNDFKYVVRASWVIFVLSGLGAVLVTLLTVSYQSIKAASANPIKSLRTE